MWMFNTDSLSTYSACNIRNKYFFAQTDFGQKYFDYHQEGSMMWYLVWCLVWCGIWCGPPVSGGVCPAVRQTHDNLIIQYVQVKY